MRGGNISQEGDVRRGRGRMEAQRMRDSLEMDDRKMMAQAEKSNGPFAGLNPILSSEQSPVGADSIWSWVLHQRDTFTYFCSVYISAQQGLEEKL